MEELDYITFRTEIRKSLGRIFFCPENINIYIEDIICLIEKNKKTFNYYMEGCNKNEEITFAVVLNYLKETKKNKHIKELIEHNLTSLKISKRN